MLLTLGAGATHCVDGIPTAEMFRRHGLGRATFHKLEAKYGAIGLSPMARPEIREAMEEVAGKRRRFGILSSARAC